MIYRVLGDKIPKAKTKAKEIKAENPWQQKHQKVSFS